MALEMVELECTSLNKKESFEINHAERILRNPNNGGWELPKDSAYQFDFNNGISKKPTKDNTRKGDKTEE